MTKSIRFSHLTYLMLLMILGTLIIHPKIYAKTSAQLDKSWYISQQNFSSDHYIESLFSKTVESFKIEDWDVSDAELELKLSTTQIVDPALSTISISLNEVHIYAEKIPITDGTPRILTLKLPTQYLKKGNNTITIESYIRTTDGLPCVDDVSSGNWMNIFSDSNVSLRYKPTIKVSSIADFFNAFASRTAMDYEQSCVAFKEGASSNDLTASLEALSYISSNATYDAENIDYIPIKELDDLKHKQYIVYVGNFSDLPSTYKDLLSDIDKRQAQRASLIKLVTTSLGQNVLLITGDNSTALLKASRLLGNKQLISQLTDSSKYISANEDVLTKDITLNQYHTLTDAGTTVTGSFRQSADFYIDMPNNRQIAAGSEIYLSFRYSDNLNFKKALVTVYINDTPIGSKALASSLANSDELTLEIPINLKITGSFNVRVAFDLELEDTWCTLSIKEMPWGYISPKSQLKLNTFDIPYILFDNYPAPFVKDNHFANVLVLVPDTMTANDYTAIGGIFRTMGRFLSNNSGNLEVKRVSEDYDVTGKNIIALGTFNNNAYIASLNDQLFFKFSTDGNSILSNEKLLIDSSYGKKLGTCQLLKTKETENNPLSYGILVVSGCTDSGLLDAASYLSTEEGLWSIYGDGYIAVNEDLSCYRFKNDNEKKIPFINKISSSKEFSIFLLTSGMVLVFLILCTLLLLNKHRKRDIHEK